MNGGSSVPYREAYEMAGSVRPHYQETLALVMATSTSDLSQRVRAAVETLEVTFRDRPFPIDVVPRLLSSDEWRTLEAGAAQRARALNAFVVDVYGDQEVVRQGILPRAVIETSAGFEPLLCGCWPTDCVPAAVVGLDVIKDATGSYLVLEDNLRSPAGMAFGDAAEEVREMVLPSLSRHRRVEYSHLAELRRSLRAAACPTQRDPLVVLLADGSTAPAWYEHYTLARRLDARVATYADLSLRGNDLALRDSHGRLRRVDVIYRRDGEERLQTPSGSLSPSGRLLLKPWLKGHLGLVNGFGTGVADDKLLHAYVPELIRFYLGEQPILDSVPTWGLATQDGRFSDHFGAVDIIESLPEFVIKPRFGQAGRGVAIYRETGPAEREQLKREIGHQAMDWIVQPFVQMSCHPSITSEGLVERYVDLRPFVFTPTTGSSPSCTPLTRFGGVNQPLIFNFSRGSGVKPTWISK